MRMDTQKEKKRYKEKNPPCFPYFTVEKTQSNEGEVGYLGDKSGPRKPEYSIV